MKICVDLDPQVSTSVRNHEGQTQKEKNTLSPHWPPRARGGAAEGVAEARLRPGGGARCACAAPGLRGKRRVKRTGS